MLIIFSVAVIGLLGWLLVTGRGGGWLGQWGLALILGGAAGNVLDRVMRHSVTDFIDFYVGSHHWYTFNIADSAIVVGAGSRGAGTVPRLAAASHAGARLKSASGFMHPILFQLGAITIYTYGVLVATGVILGLWYARRQAARAGLPPGKSGTWAST